MRHTLSQRNMRTAERFRDFGNNHRVLCTTYRDWYGNAEQGHHQFDYVILCDADSLSSKNAKRIPQEYPDAKILGVFSVDKMESGNIFSGTPRLYAGRAATSNWGRAQEEQILDFVKSLLEQNGYGPGPKHDRIPFPDLTFTDGQNNIYIEIKSYLGRTVPRVNINRAVDQMAGLMDKMPVGTKGVLLLLCEVDDKLKQMVHEKHRFSIWDISNILYLCGENDELQSSFTRILPYAITGIASAKPYGSLSLRPAPAPHSIVVAKHEDLKKRLLACRPGRSDSTAYENVCADIIRYLFEGEFSILDDQHKTDDTMFRMDLLCGLKGTTTFWHFLTHYYRSKFVVFEFKNYKDPIQQNLVYVTDKYLFSPALRKVAIIVSRAGFDANARKAAEGTLKENGKLVLDVCDEDLLKMLDDKANGEEPSDHLMRLTEAMLMGISK